MDPGQGTALAAGAASAVHTVPRYSRYSCPVTGSLAPELGDPGSTESAL